MRIIRLAALTLIVLAAAHPAFAQTNPYNISWAALNPGNDWAAQVLRSLFPIPGNTPGASTGSEATVIGTILGQFTGFIAAIACAFVCYTTVMNIHRAAETSQILGQGQSWMFVVRVAFAAIMMFPLGGGFSAGQQLVMQGAMWGVGMAKVLYANAIQAVGPDAVVIAQPMIPGTENVISDLIDSELCMDLVNLAGGINNNGGQPLVPAPQPIAINNGANGGYATWRYSLSTGNESGDPACGTVTIREAGQNESTIAGQNVDMASVQQAVLTNVLQGDLRNQVASVAANLWTTKDASAMTPLQGIFQSAVNDYTSQLTTAATTVQKAINTAIQTNAAQARNGGLDLIASEIQQSTLGWTAAGAYYLEIARLNADTLSLLSDTPVVTSPTYEGLSKSLSYDLAPLETALTSFMSTLQTVVATSDGTQPPTGVPTTLASAENTAKGSSILDRLFKALDLSQPALNTTIKYLLPSAQIWTDPFGGLVALGQTLVNTALIAFGICAVLSSTTATAGTAIWNFLPLNWGAAAASVAGHMFISTFAIPIYSFLLALLLPGIIITYVLPMIPYVLWMAGVCGWIILVCEAMVAVPLWMLAHMTVGGDGLHGRAIEGWGLLFNVMFRHVLMVLGLFLGYFVFDCMSWLIRESFGIAAGFTLAGGWIVANWIGTVVLLNIFAMLQVVAALMSFRMVMLLPHHLPRLLGWTAANRVDAEAFYQQAAWIPGIGVGTGTQRALTAGVRQLRNGAAQASEGGQPKIGYATDRGDGMDTTLRAVTDPGGQDNGDV
ncbi:MAG: DotA/TraY family protein [Acetobacteraceae bacterium]